MTLTQKEIDTLATFNRNGLKYEYVESKTLGIGGVEKIVNKMVKINAKAKKANPVMEMAAKGKEMSSVEAQDVMEASRKRQLSNLR